MLRNLENYHSPVQTVFNPNYRPKTRVFYMSHFNHGILTKLKKHPFLSSKIKILSHFCHNCSFSGIKVKNLAIYTTCFLRKAVKKCNCSFSYSHFPPPNWGPIDKLNFSFEAFLSHITSVKTHNFFVCQQIWIFIVSRKFQRSFKEASRVFKRRLKGVSKEFSVHFKGI